MEQVDILNKIVAESLQTDKISFAIEEIIVAREAHLAALYNMSPKSYMFQYI